MDLKIKDVAELLNVSETTIRRWLSDGKIPAYRINHQYRFSRTEIEDWVLGSKLGNSIDTDSVKQKQEESEEPPHSTGSRQYSLYRAIHRGGVYHDVPGSTKEEVIRNSLQMVARSLNLDAEVLIDLVLDRENLQPTALNHGIGIPHTRDSLVRLPFDAVTVVFPEQEIEYGSLDGKPVHTLLFLFAREDKRHLHLLAKIAHLSSREEIVDYLKTKPSKQQLLEYIKDWETSLQ